MIISPFLIVLEVGFEVLEGLAPGGYRLYTLQHKGRRLSGGGIFTDA